MATEFFLANAPILLQPVVNEVVDFKLLFGLEQTQLAIPLSATPPPVTGQLWPLAAG